MEPPYLVEAITAAATMARKIGRDPLRFTTRKHRQTNPVLLLKSK
jgi:hypothetical protein